MKEKVFKNWKMNAVQFNFPNGNWLSTTWDSGTYSQNWQNRDYGSGKCLPSDTVEVMFDCGEKLKKKILKKYNGGDLDPVGHLKVKEWSEILSLLVSEKK